MKKNYLYVLLASTTLNLAINAMEEVPNEDEELARAMALSLASQSENQLDPGTEDLLMQHVLELSLKDSQSQDELPVNGSSNGVVANNNNNNNNGPAPSSQSPESEKLNQRWKGFQELNRQYTAEFEMGHMDDARRAEFQAARWDKQVETLLCPEEMDVLLRLNELEARFAQLLPTFKTMNEFNQAYVAYRLARCKTHIQIIKDGNQHLKDMILEMECFEAKRTGLELYQFGKAQ